MWIVAVVILLRIRIIASFEVDVTKLIATFILLVLLLLVVVLLIIIGICHSIFNFFLMILLWGTITFSSGVIVLILIIILIRHSLLGSIVALRLLAH